MITRDMSMIAITIANEVAIAQIVSLASWSGMLESTAVNIVRVADLLKVIPYIGLIYKIGRFFEQSSS